MTTTVARHRARTIGGSRSMRLVLFDIDGTLLREGLAPKIAFARALRETYATTGPINEFKFA
ncbi:MAG TPA: hypothetical protein VFB81_24740, partial [Myxococcales bacterium]|nr:hypothetical protein [Myxococcales bacterium]